MLLIALKNLDIFLFIDDLINAVFYFFSILGVCSQKAEEVEKMLAELGISPHTPSTPLEEGGGTDTDTGSARASPARQQTPATAEASPATMLYRTRGRVNLQKSEVVQVNLLPKEQVRNLVYS